MMRLLRFILNIAVVAALALWLADSPGTAHIVWHDTVIETSAAFLALMVVAAAYALHLFLRLVHFLRHGPVHWRLRRKINKLQQGQNQLTQGLIAIAAGNASEAGRLAVAARKNSDQSVATLWLQAQAAQLAGDSHAAHSLFRTLAAHPEATVLGFRGLITEAKRANKWDEVDRLISELAQIKSNTPWLNLIRLQSAARRGAWEEAQTALVQASKARLITKETTRHTRAALHLALSREATQRGDTDQALRAAEQAAQQSPEWLPARLGLVEALVATRHNRTAKRLIERAWATTPHPALAQILADMAATPLDAFKQIESLCRKNEQTPASRLALAEAALAAHIWGEARRHLTASIKDGTASQETFRKLARLERGEHKDERAAAAWILRGMDAAADPIWLCTHCHGHDAVWQPTCRSCGSFNRMHWQIPGQKAEAASALVYEKGIDDES